MRTFWGLAAGPFIIIFLGFAVFGQWGAIIAFFVSIAAAVFCTVLFLIDRAIGPLPLWAIILVSMAIPAVYGLWSCMGHACPNYTLAAASPQYIAAAFCGLVYRIVAGRRR